MPEATSRLTTCLSKKKKKKAEKTKMKMKKTQKQPMNSEKP